ncbi:dehydrogenase, partial [Dietzia sp. SLG510A3-3B2-2]|nr:dehydrogenase [Dietzia sp. SLG510A3-3B2-2]
RRIGVALMNPVGRGRIGDDGTVHLSEDPHDAAVLAGAAAMVAERMGLDGDVTVSTSQHLSGTARVGEVLDDSGRVLGVQGLRVADASALPSLPRCGPYYTVLAVAEDLATRVIAERAW